MQNSYKCKIKILKKHKKRKKKRFIEKNLLKNYSEFLILAVRQNQKLKFKNVGKKFPRFPRFQRVTSFRPGL